MPARKPALTNPDTERFLAAHKRAYLFVRTAAGEARGWPLTAFYNDGVLWFTTYGKSAKMPHIHAARRGSVAVLTDEGVTPVSYVVAEGPISVRSADAATIQRALDSRPEELRLDPAHEQRYRGALESGKRVIIEVRVERTEHHMAGAFA
jgi:hypothetical protein